MLGNVTATTTVEVILLKNETATLGTNIWNINRRQAEKIKGWILIIFGRRGPDEMCFVQFNSIQCVHWSIPVDARSKACVCNCSLAGIAILNPAGGMDVCLLGVLCVVR
jgi:hypothetical protein